MQFSDTNTNTLSGLVQDITFLLGGIDTNEYGLADRTRNMNARFGMVWQMIFESYGGWRFMDDNSSDATTGVPYADQTITNGTGLYLLPTGSLVIDSVEVKPSGGVLTPIEPITHAEFMDRGGDASYPSTGVPLFYMLQGDVMRLLPTPNYTQTLSIRIYFEGSFTAFTYADTTAAPGFASVFHRMLSVGAALDYAIAKGMTEKITTLSSTWNDYETRLRKFYAKRWRDRQPAKLTHGADLADEFGVGP